MLGRLIRRYAKKGSYPLRTLDCTVVGDDHTIDIDTPAVELGCNQGRSVNRRAVIDQRRHDWTMRVKAYDLIQRCRIDQIRVANCARCVRLVVTRTR